MEDDKRQRGLTEPPKWLDLYGDQLYRYAFARVQNRMIAEDLVQETFLSALAGADEFEGRSSEKTWLTSILKHKIIDHFRKMGRQWTNQSDDPEKQMLFIRQAMSKFTPESSALESEASLSPETRERIRLALKQR